MQPFLHIKFKDFSRASSLKLHRLRQRSWLITDNPEKLMRTRRLGKSSQTTEERALNVSTSQLCCITDKPVFVKSIGEPQALEFTFSR